MKASYTNIDLVQILCLYSQQFPLS